MDEWRSAITIVKQGKHSWNPNTLQLIMCADVRTSKTGIGGRGAASESPTLNGTDWIWRDAELMCAWWLDSTAQKRVQSEVEGKRRELSSNGTCATWCRVRDSAKQNSNRNSWKGEKVYWTTFSGGSDCEKEGTIEALSRRREGICHCDKLEQSKFFHATVTHTNSNRITYNQKFLSRRKAVSSREKRKN